MCHCEPCFAWRCSLPHDQEIATPLENHKRLAMTLEGWLPIFGVKTLMGSEGQILTLSLEWNKIMRINIITYWCFSFKTMNGT